MCTTCRYIHESRFVNDEVEPVDQVSEVITAKPEVRVMTGASKGENRSQRNDPSVVQKYQSLQRKPGDVHVTPRVHKFQFFP